MTPQRSPELKAAADRKNALLQEAAEKIAAAEKEAALHKGCFLDKADGHHHRAWLSDSGPKSCAIPKTCGT